MTRVRKARDINPYPAHWVIATDYRPDGNHPLTPGREFTATGIRGRLRFRHHVTNTRTGQNWVECFDKHRKFRSIDPARIRTVHRKVIA